MLTIKAQKYGNSMMVTIPSALGVEEGEEFFVMKKENGAITLIPKEEDHFKNVGNQEYYMPELDAGYVSPEEELDNI